MIKKIGYILTCTLGKKLKKRLEDLERRADNTSESHVGLYSMSYEKPADYSLGIPMQCRETQYAPIQYDSTPPQGQEEYTPDLPELTYSTNNSSIRSTMITNPMNHHHLYYGLEEEKQTNKAQSPVDIMRKSAVMADFSHVGQIHHPNESKEVDDE